MSKATVLDKVVRKLVNERHDGYSLIHADVPKKLYHTSNPSFRNDIASKGLMPQVGASYSLHWDNDTELVPGIFLASEKYDSTYDDDVYEIDPNSLDGQYFYKDPDPYMDDCYFYTKPIDIKHCKLIYEGRE